MVFIGKTGFTVVFEPALSMYNLRGPPSGHPDRHVIRVRPHPVPEISVYDHPSGEITILPPDPVDMTLSHDVMCVGRFEGDGYRPCPHRQRVGHLAQCSDCGTTVIPHQECIFEPRCEGEACGEGICTVEHAVYLAFFGPLPKVGMSTAARVAERVAEQGADGYAVAATVPNRLRARRMERAIAGLLGIRQSVRSTTFLGMMTEEVDREAMGTAHGTFAERLTGALGLELSPLRTIRYDLPVLDSVPVEVTAPGRHRGEYVGSKGRFLVYDDGDGPRALRLRAIRGRFLLDVL